MSVRPFTDEDRPQLVHLWQTIFGDDAAFIHTFFNRIVLSGRGMIWDENGTVAAAAYIIDGITVDARSFPYIYAVSTLPEFRGRGYGAAVSSACADLILAEGGVPVLHPAEASLFTWYAHQNFFPISQLRQGKIMTYSNSTASVTPVSVREYLTLRRQMLEDFSFAEFTPQLLDWWAEWSGGHFFSSPDGCFCLCENGSSVFVPEILTRGSAAALLSAAAPNREVLVRGPALPGFDDFAPELPFLAARDSSFTEIYWPFVFD